MHKFFDIGMAVILVAGIMVMVRPGSQGPKLVSSVTSGFAGVIGAATGGGKF